jgi:sugar O-acyltransferase (sialic acid O-acetyltransferase NeuD family)
VTRRLVLLGAGGHARVVAALAGALGVEVVAVFDDDPARRGATFGGITIEGPLPVALDAGLLASCQAIIAVGANAARAAIVRRAALPWSTLVHPFAWVDPAASLGAGTVVFAGAVVQPGASLGAHVILNTAATVDHDCVLGDFVHLAPGVHLAGEVRVGEGALVGIGASVLPGRVIGAWARVGAGAVVVEDVPAGATVVGVPARVLERAPKGDRSPEAGRA